MSSLKQKLGLGLSAAALVVIPYFSGNVLAQELTKKELLVAEQGIQRPVKTSESKEFIVYDFPISEGLKSVLSRVEEPSPYAKFPTCFNGKPQESTNLIQLKEGFLRLQVPKKCSDETITLGIRGDYSGSSGNPISSFFFNPIEWESSGTIRSIVKDLEKSGTEHYKPLTPFTKNSGRAKLSFIAGQEGYGLGVSVDWKLNDKWRAGPYAQLNFSEGESNSDTNTTIRERKFIGPATYELRTDKITTNSTTKYPYEVGISASRKIMRDFELSLNAGIARKSENISTSGESIIDIERNATIIDSKTIYNSIPGEEKNGFVHSLSAGMDYNFTPNTSVGFKINNTGSGIKILGEVGLKF